MSTRLPEVWAAIIWSGAVPDSTQRSMAPTTSGPGPPHVFEHARIIAVFGADIKAVTRGVTHFPLGEVPSGTSPHCFRNCRPASASLHGRGRRASRCL